ncbi:hypothetical protein JWJ90_05105 [Desulfobulbus rhabdoformis]|uniref:DVU3141 family protein n=1 Tax=Desulfobulbus rhabdoformis TaxID=34032 RepID=UPI001963A9B7|nr:DVU3141 family protein [Desulfobulbus rhabdoformis]MBM9613664.1 hypothetical protein [Desulfobulbus rhabdoformis]
MLHRWYARLLNQAQVSLTIFFPLLFLSGCALQNPFSQPTITEKGISEKNLLLLKIKQLQQGDTVTLNDPAFGGVLQAKVIDSYFSAAGVDCKRLIIKTMTDSQQILICNNPTKGWAVVNQVDK